MQCGRPVQGHRDVQAIYLPVHEECHSITNLYNDLSFAFSFSCITRFACTSAEVEIHLSILIGQPLPLRFTYASTDIPPKTMAAPAHWPAVSECLYTTTDNTIVNILRVSVIILNEYSQLQAVDIERSALTQE